MEPKQIMMNRNNNILYTHENINLDLAAGCNYGGWGKLNKWMIGFVGKTADNN